MDGRGYAWDPTYNFGPMFREAKINNFDGKLASECAPILRAGIADMEANPEKYTALNSSNGWGVFDEKILNVLRDILGCMERHPYAKVTWR